MCEIGLALTLDRVKDGPCQNEEVGYDCWTRRSAIYSFLTFADLASFA